MEKQVVLEFRNIVKKYPGTVALNDVSVAFREGEIHAIVGENGAGKSTLIKTCSGAVIPTEGQILVGGEVFTHFTPVVSQEKGIAIIYQEFNLVKELNVADNVFLGNFIYKGKRTAKGLLPDFKEMERKTREICERFQLKIDPKAIVGDLSIGYQQMIEIVKAISMQAKILIMDEPTAPLTTNEVDMLMNIIQQLKSDGVTVIYISHRLEEIFSISDRVTVLRDGELIQTMNTSETNREELIKLMVGRTLKETFPERKNDAIGEVVLETRNLTGNGVQDISIKVRRGEIVGLAGIMGAGRTETAQMLFGMVHPAAGEILFNGEAITLQSPYDAATRGIALVPEDRKNQGILLKLSISDNISLAKIRQLSKRTVIHKKRETELVGKFKETLRIRTPSVKNAAESLSGGNQQKVVLAKWLAMEPQLIILDEPTRGIDVGAKQEIYNLMNELVAGGKAILLITSEMEELVGMADRLYVLSEGRQTGELERWEFDEELILEKASITAGGV